MLVSKEQPGHRGYVPAFEGVHELARGVEAAAHQDGLLAHHRQGIFEQPRLVLDQRRRCHSQLRLIVVWFERRCSHALCCRMTTRRTSITPRLPSSSCNVPGSSGARAHPPTPTSDALLAFAFHMLMVHRWSVNLW